MQYDDKMFMNYEQLISNNNNNNNNSSNNNTNNNNNSNINNSNCRIDFDQFTNYQNYNSQNYIVSKFRIEMSWEMTLTPDILCGS